MDDGLFRLHQESELEKLHHTIPVFGTSGTAVTTDFPACKPLAQRDIAVGNARDVRCIVVRDHLAFVGVANGGIACVDITDPTQATVIGGIVAPNVEPTALALDGNMLYVADRATGFHALDITNPQRPLHTASLPALVHTQNRRILVWNRTLVLVNDHAFSVYDLGDPHKPVPLAYHHRLRSGAGFFKGAAIVGSHLYLTQGALGMWTFDLSVPSRPRAVSGVAISLESRPTEKLVASALAVWHGRVVVGTSSGVWVGSLRADGGADSEAFFTGPGCVRDMAQGESRDGQFQLSVFEPYDHAHYIFDLAPGPRYLGRQRMTRAVDRIWNYHRGPGYTLAAAGVGGLLVLVP